MRTLGVVTNEGFSCTIVEDDDGRVHFTADADIDADGANGHSGGPAAYRSDDSGTELLANGGMKIVAGGRLVRALARHSRFGLRAPTDMSRDA